MRGFSLVEVLLAVATFALIVTALVGAYLYGQEATALAGNRARAVMLAEEGLEAARNIRDAEYANLTDGTHGLATTSNQWNLSGSSDTIGVFMRQLIVSTVDSERKDVSYTVSWQQNPQRTGSVTLTSRMTKWQGSAPPVGSCNDYAVQQGYSAGTCRPNAVQCIDGTEVYLPAGDTYCTGGVSADICCAAL